MGPIIRTVLETIFGIMVGWFVVLTLLMGLANIAGDYHLIPMWWDAVYVLMIVACFFFPLVILIKLGSIMVLRKKALKTVD